MRKKVLSILGIFLMFLMILCNQVKATDDEIDYEAILQEFIDNNITSDMSELDKLKEITKYTAENYDYSVKYQSYQDMIKYGGGDCWASTNMIVKLCKMVGIQAKGRNANKDAGAGSGHRNAIALIDGQYYIAEAGYAGSKPRYYSVYATSEYTCNYDYNTKNATIIQYDGFGNDIVIPSKIGEYTVTEIGDSAFHRSSVEVKSVMLPNTIKKIGDFAFFYCSSLEEISIPSSVVEMGAAPFCLCKNLKKINIEGDNFVIENNCIYNKDKTKLVEVLWSYDDEKLVIPETVKVIGAGAACYDETVRELILPSKLEEIEYSAFWRSRISGGITIPGSCKVIGNSAFASSYLGSIIVENGVKTIENSAFYSMYYLQSIQISSSVEKLGDYLISSYKEFVVYGEKDSAIETYANNNSLSFVEGEINEIFPFNVWFSHGYINSTGLVYNGKEQHPYFRIQIGGKVLEEGKDYKVTYKDESINYGKHIMTITGIGKYKGSFDKEYTIEQAEATLEFTCNDSIEGIRLSPIVTYNPNNLKVNFWYKKVGYSSYTNGAPISAGEYEVWPYFDGNYKDFYSKRIKVKIVEKENGWNNVNDDFYYVLDNGNFAKDWHFINNVWYYFDQNGKMVINWNLIDNKWYWFDKNGAMATNWKLINNIWYYFKSSGVMVTNWNFIDNKWYWFDGSGAMATGWKYINNVWYYFDSNGKMVTNWNFIDNKWYWFDGNGSMVTGWRFINNKWYYFETNGEMFNGSTKNINGSIFEFDASGAWIK